MRQLARDVLSSTSGRRYKSYKYRPSARPSVASKSNKPFSTKNGAVVYPDPLELKRELGSESLHAFISFDGTIMSGARVTLFEDIFEVTTLNPDRKTFDRVNRIAATGTTFECDLLLDVNCEIYSLKEGEKVTLVLASTLNLDGTPDDHFSYAPNAGEPTLADNYEYVMHGRVFDITYKGDGMVVIAASFGGLLMRLTGDQRHLSSVQPDMRLYILIKKD